MSGMKAVMAESVAYTTYREKEQELIRVRGVNGGHYHEDEDTVLEAMGDLWWGMSEEERQKIDSEPPRSLITPMKNSMFINPAYTRSIPMEKENAHREDQQTIRLLQGDTVTFLKELPEASIGTVVTDPPYG